MASNKTILGLLFILAGITYGSLAIDKVYSYTLGFLVQHQWVQPPVPNKPEANFLGRKPVILFYSLTLIIIGLFILWNREI